MTDPVTLTRTGNIGLICIDNPPVNALSFAVRRGLVSCITQADADSKIDAVVIWADGRTFPAGADITEFDRPPIEPALVDVCDHIEGCSKPVIAALHGTVLGGGFEVALGSHFRIAAPGTRFGFPEVLIGILPGAGGSQRMPRITGAGPALDLMIKGSPINLEKVVALGLVDRVSLGDLKEDALNYAAEILVDKIPIRRVSERSDGFADQAAYTAAIEATRSKMLAANSPLFAPMRILECIEAAAEMPYPEGRVLEYEKIRACVEHPQHAALVHAFFAERKSVKFPEAGRAKPRNLAKIGVIGGGTMGAGITVAALDAGLEVIMVERDAQSIARGKENVEKVYQRHVDKGRITAEKMDAVMARYTPATGYELLGDVDLVIEAVFEEMSVKKTVFTALDKVLKPGAVIASNTSFLDINEIASVTSRPDDVIGLHFFSPANIMRLLEIVIPDKVSDETVATGLALAKMMRKTPVRSGVCDGFIGNRMIAKYGDVASHLVEEGASPYQVDAAVREFGYPIGPFQMSDLAGGDIGWAVRKRHAKTRDPKARYVPIADRLCENGWFGQKTGRGYYIYENGSRVGTQDPEVLAIIDAERARAGITPRSFTNAEIVDRYLAAMINEGADIVHEGIASCPSDVDVIKVYGYAFPRFRGGPMKYADMIGLDKVLATIHKMAEQDPMFWVASPLLVDLVAKGKNFDSLNKG
ncbi:MAG: 3-hydroxyacyl-CoA dehydrogenase NAD-binding domain-containing protein [Paracoccaceae bacterium]|jgi:3-hydroxyacyl-CoA dehydrogenase